MNKEQYVVDDHGRRTAVILPAKVYDQLLEDIHDLAVVAERRQESTITLAEMKKRMKKVASYSIRFKNSVEKDFKKLPNSVL